MECLNFCRIRQAAAADLERLLTWRNHPAVRCYMLSQHEITLDEHRRWFERASRDPRKALIIVEDGGEDIGYVQFTRINDAGVADWGFYAVPGAAKGVGRKIGVAALHYAYARLGLHKVCGQALSFNSASINFHRQLGFRREGVLREQYLIEGIFYDLVCFGLLRSEWAAGQECREKV